MEIYELCEMAMLLCFGISWPIAVYKSIKTKSTQGKSVVFILAIVTGYVAGIIGKVSRCAVTGEKLSYVLIIYCVNLIVVLTDLALYFVNKSREKEQRKGLVKIGV